MAVNSDAPFGLTPIKHRNGAPYNGANRLYYVPSTYATALFVGDPVIKIGTANAAAIQGHNIATLPEINKATAGDGNDITGVIIGFDADGDNQSRTHNPASTERVVHVADDPDLLFIIQDDAGGTLTVADVGQNVNLVFTTAGSTSTGQSGVEFDSSATAADQSNQLTLQRLFDEEGNTIANFGIWEVKINQHTEADNKIGI